MTDTRLDRPVDESTTGPSTTSRTARILAVAAFAVVIATYSKLVGLPSDTLQVIGWMWLATIAWNIQASRGTHLLFLRDWWPAIAVLEVYLYSRGLADNIGLSVHVTEPIPIDRWIGGGQLPTTYLQEQLCGNPCTSYVPPHWYDGALTIVYYTHFIAAPAVAVVLWLRNRVTWLSFMRRYVTLYIAGLFIYITYPMAPPWMAAEDGYLAGDPVARITGRGWSQLGIEHFHQWLSRMGNQVAAMPSLHAGTAALIAFYGISRLQTPWRFLLLGYPLAMSFMLVYYGEHYIVDIIAGFILAGLVLWGCTSWERGGAVKQAVVAVSAGVLSGPADPLPSQRPEKRIGTAAEPRDLPPPSQEEDRGRAFLAWLRQLPPLVVPCVLVVLVWVGLMASVYAAVPALTLIGGFVAWTANLSWPDLDLRGRLLRGLVLGVLLALAISQIIT